MKKIILSLAVGFLALACSENPGDLLNSIPDKDKTQSAESLLITYEPTGLLTNKTHLAGCTSVTVSSPAFSRGNGIPAPPWMVYEKGILFSTNPNNMTYVSPNPVYLIACACNCDCGVGAFSVTLTNLVANTKYYVRTYAIAVNGPSPPATKYVGYGEVEDFYVNKPNFTNVGVTNLTGTTATSGGFFDDQGCSLPTTVGVCWATTQNPTTANAHTTQTPQTGDDWYWTSYLTNLIPKTKYYYRAYVINSQGTWYQPQLNFTTPACPQFATSNGYIIVSPTSIDNGVPTNVNATINDYVSGLNVAVSASTDYNCTPTSNSFNWNGVNPCWNGLFKYTSVSGAYFTVQMTMTKTGCPTDVKQAKILVNATLKKMN